MVRPSMARVVVALVSVMLAHLLPASRVASAAEALAPGSWSVQFSVQPDFTLGSYSGSTLSLKRHLGSGNALRLGVSLGFANVGDDASNVMVNPSTTSTELIATDSNSSTIGVNTYYLWYAGGSSPVHAYWGAGPTVSWARRHDERTTSQTSEPSGGPPTTSMVVDDIHFKDWRAGVAGTAGVEWLVARRVGLIAEYASSLVYGSASQTRVSTHTSPGGTSTVDLTQEANRWDFSGSGGRLGVSVYY
jgi:hypothetical protein